METHVPIVILHEDDAKEIGVYALDRVYLEQNDKSTVCVIDTTKELAERGTVLLTKDLHNWQGEIEVKVAFKPISVKYIRKKLQDQELEKEEIQAIIKDINDNRLSDIELGAYVSALYANDRSMREIADLTQAMVDIGEHLEWGGEVVADKHSIGGVPGNRVTPVIVPIIAAAGIKIPKTSSRAITSPAGTADTMEAFCSVDFSLPEIREIVEETNGCMVWGGSVQLSPVDDKIIRAEHPLSIDPEGQVIASVLSKKKAAGSTHVVIDLPYGEGSKVGDTQVARSLAEKFKRTGEMLGMKVACTITRGDQPIGNGIGPNLEARDVLKVLKGGGPQDLRVKSIRLTDTLLELCGKTPNAAEYLDNGKALEKFREIIGKQGGNPDVEVEDLELGALKEEICAERAGVVTHISNKGVAEAARRTGAPKDLGAGIYLEKKVGERVAEGDCLMVVYADNQDKLDDALKQIRYAHPYRIMREDEMLIEEL